MKAYQKKNTLVISMQLKPQTNLNEMNGGTTLTDSHYERSQKVEKFRSLWAKTRRALIHSANDEMHRREK